MIISLMKDHIVMTANGSRRARTSFIDADIRMLSVISAP